MQTLKDSIPLALAKAVSIALNFSVLAIFILPCKIKNYFAEHGATIVLQQAWPRLSVDTVSNVNHYFK